jgi:hypothetical protein
MQTLTHADGNRLVVVARNDDRLQLLRTLRTKELRVARRAK